MVRKSKYDWRKSAAKGLATAVGIFLLAAGDAAVSALATGEVNATRLIGFAVAGGALGLGKAAHNARKNWR